MPRELLEEVRAAARDTGLSQQDVVRQSLKAGLPKVRKQFALVPNLKPFTKNEVKRAFGPDPEWDPIEERIVRRQRHRVPDIDLRPDCAGTATTTEVVLEGL